MVSTLQGTLIRLRVADVSQFSRSTQGVRIIRLTDDDQVGAVTRVIPEEDEGEGEEGEAEVGEVAAESDGAPEVAPEGE
jgi:DNA gyrase subunit A